MQPSDFKVPPVIKTVTYAGSPEDAFDRFAVEIGKWWPMETHSLGKAVDASSISFECLEAGGALVERCKSGDFHVWGSIVDIRHPRPISFTWHVGRPQDTAQRSCPPTWCRSGCISVGLSSSVRLPLRAG
jgi:uncharacterized protein YndB with AHSA1/START domain